MMVARAFIERDVVEELPGYESEGIAYYALPVSKQKIATELNCIETTENFILLIVMV